MPFARYLNSQYEHVTNVRSTLLDICMRVIDTCALNRKVPKRVETGAKLDQCTVGSPAAEYVDQILLLPRCFNAKANSSNLA
jgi:hypothetical protein